MVDAAVSREERRVRIAALERLILTLRDSLDEAVKELEALKEAEDDD